MQYIDIALKRTQVTEKCPTCGHPEAFYEEKQVGSEHTAHDKPHPTHRCAAQTKAPRFSILYVSAPQRWPLGHTCLFSVRLLQTRVADQQLGRKRHHGGIRGMRCQPCALHVYPYTTKKGNHAETAEDACE